MRAGHTFGELLEEWCLYLLELLWMDDIQDLFHFPQIHDFLGTVGLGPELKQAIHNLHKVT